MQQSFVPPQLSLLVFTDLDGTLLDHHDYGFDAARPALALLQRYRVPLIPTTSKTLAEVAELNRVQLANRHPCIVENGSVLCLPDGYFATSPGDEQQLGYRLMRLAPDHRELRKVLDGLRRDGFQFRAFSDMSVSELAADSGLDAPSAGRAKQRLCSEPLLWQDSDHALRLFVERLAQHGLQLTRGGRYWHVMGQTSKATAMARLCQLYRAAGFAGFTTIALGDSPNDIEMLGAADIAVIVQRPDGSHLDCRGQRDTVITRAAGPAGWNAAMLQLLQRLGPPTSAAAE